MASVNPGIPTRVWTRVVLTVLFVLTLVCIGLGFYLVVQDVHDRTCHAINRQTQFIKDTDGYIVRHSLHPDDPAINGFHKFLQSEAQGDC